MSRNTAATRTARALAFTPDPAKLDGPMSARQAGLIRSLAKRGTLPARASRLLIACDWAPRTYGEAHAIIQAILIESAPVAAPVKPAPRVSVKPAPAAVKPAPVAAPVTVKPAPVKRASKAPVTVRSIATGEPLPLIAAPKPTRTRYTVRKDAVLDALLAVDGDARTIINSIKAVRGI